MEGKLTSVWNKIMKSKTNCELAALIGENERLKEIFDIKRRVPSRRGEREVQLAGRYSWSTLP